MQLSKTMKSIVSIMERKSTNIKRVNCNYNSHFYLFVDNEVQREFQKQIDRRTVDALVKQGLLSSSKTSENGTVLEMKLINKHSVTD